MTFDFSSESTWPVYPLPEYVFFQEGPGLRNWQYRDAGIPFVNIRCLRDGRLLRSEMTCLDPKEVSEKYSHFLLDEGDYVVSSSGTLGRLAEVFPQDLPCMLNTSVIRFRPKNPTTLDRQYLRYFLTSKLFENQILSFANGSAQLNYGPSHLKQMGIIVPPRDVQTEIGQTLGSLDDRITLLRETNRTLEAIAQAIFKSWFIDFDPVRAKMEGRTLAGLDEETAALFPDELVESEIGLVPKGWAVEGLDRVANYLNGLALQKFPPTGHDDLPVIKIAQLRKGDTIGADKASRALKPEYIVKDGDVLFSWSGSLEVEIWCGGEGALNQHLFKVTSEKFEKWFYFLWTRKHLEHFRQIAASKATTMGHIQRSHLSDAKVVVPDKKVLAVANELFNPIIDRITANALQSKTLAEIRDALLPRLISGKLRCDSL